MKMSRSGSLWLTSAGLIALLGCATFEPGLHYQDIIKGRQPTVSETREAMEVSVEEFVTAQKSLQAFDADVAPNGVLALLLRIENMSKGFYRLPRNNIKAYLGERPLVALSGKDAANQAATREYAGKAIASTVAAGPFAILWLGLPTVASLSHTHSINKKIEQHFGGLEFPDTLLRPNKAVAGFVYFKLPDNVKTLENLTLEVEPLEEKSEKQLSLRFSLPTLELSSPILTSATERPQEAKQQ